MNYNLLVSGALVPPDARCFYQSFTSAIIYLCLHALAIFQKTEIMALYEQNLWDQNVHI
jgi:hypothetical protein